MGLSTKQMARLGDLLDQALPLSAAERRAWLGALAEADQPLVRALREALLADDPEIAAIRTLDRLPARGARFTAVPPRIEAFGTFPVRAFAELPVARAGG